MLDTGVVADSRPDAAIRCIAFPAIVEEPEALDQGIPASHY